MERRAWQEEAVGLGREETVSPLEGVAAELCMEESIEFRCQRWVDEAIEDAEGQS